MYRTHDGWEAASKAEKRALSKEDKAAIRALRDRIKALDPQKTGEGPQPESAPRSSVGVRPLSHREVEKLFNCPPHPRKRKAAEAVE